eukprot:4566939-Amphidinium_carterae.1
MSLRGHVGSRADNQVLQFGDLTRHPTLLYLLELIAPGMASLTLLRGAITSLDSKMKGWPGEEICDAASDDEPWFEPEQMVQMMNIWMDACIAKLDEEALNVTAKALRWAKAKLNQTTSTLRTIATQGCTLTT